MTVRMLVEQCAGGGEGRSRAAPAPCKGQQQRQGRGVEGGVPLGHPLLQRLQTAAGTDLLNRHRTQWIDGCSIEGSGLRS